MQSLWEEIWESIYNASNVNNMFKDFHYTFLSYYVFQTYIKAMKSIKIIG